MRGVAGYVDRIRCKYSTKWGDADGGNVFFLGGGYALIIILNSFAFYNHLK